MIIQEQDISWRKEEGVGEKSVIRCLGLDLGSWVTGACVLEEKDREVTLICERTFRSPRQAFEKRLVYFVDAVTEMVGEHRPTLATLELPFYGRDVRSLCVLAQVRGAVLVVLERAGVGVVDMAPRKVKGAVVGHGEASKEQVARMMQHTLGVDSFSSEDASDAAAVAYAGLLQTRNVS